MAAEDGLKAQKLLAQGVWMQNTLFFQGVLDVTYDTPPSSKYVRHELCLTGESPEQALIAGIA